MAKEIIIAGAGIAGMTAAINLAKNGFGVKIVEKGSEVGIRFHGDFQFLENWTREEQVLDSLKRMNIETNFPVIPVHNGTAYDYRRREYKFCYEKPVMYTIRRGPFEDCLDLCLKKQAMKAGVKFAFNERADLSKVDIIATGPSRESLVYVAGVSFETDIDHDIRVMFDQSIAPNVYAYMIVCRRRGVICAAYTKEFKHRKPMAKYIEDAVRSFQDTGSFQISNPVPFRNYGISPVLKTHRKIVVGEAAGFQDATWGFGLRFAMISAYLASQSISENKDYWNQVKKHVLPYTATTMFNRFFFERFYKLFSVRLLKSLSTSDNPDRILEKIYRPSTVKGCFFGVLAKHFGRRQRLRVKADSYDGEE